MGNSVKGPLVKLTVVAVAAVLASVLVYSTLRNTVSGTTQTYVAEFTDVTGLHEGDDVRIAGVKVGRIESMALTGVRADVSFTVQTDQPVFANTRALIRYQNLIGQRYLALLPGSGASQPLGDGARIPPERTEPSLDLSALLNGFEPLFSMLEPADINQLSGTIIGVLQGEGPALNSLLSQSAALTGKLAERDQVLGDVLTKLTGALDHLAGKDAEFERLIGQAKHLVGSFDGKTGPIFGAMERIDKVSGNISGLLEDIRPALRADLGKFNQVAGLFLKEGPDVEATLQAFPGFLGGLARVSQYGSWLNLYACSIDINLAPFPVGLLPQLAGGKQSEVCR
ncbi:MCE family protein [Amycolatopsis nigrescens]|uniref:MCE family protein n=1 Tax=Amycolatopsis nigrescens TaxID=381445 RepID=UPI000365D03D|nr:MCE family protein [Amycolatopsis nigrescens]